MGSSGSGSAGTGTVGEPAEAHAVDPSLPLIVEGSGLLTPATARLGDVRVWLESPAASRKQRALARDGEAYPPALGAMGASRRSGTSPATIPTRLATHVFAVP